LSDEIDFLERKLQQISARKHRRFNQLSSKLGEIRQIAFLRLHLLQFYWTMTRFCGLAYLHDGRRLNDGRSLRSETRPARPWLDTDHVEFVRGPRVLIDVTDTYRNGYNTGIQRVVRQIAKASIVNGSGLPVVIEDGRLLSYFRHPDLPEVVEIRAGDRFLLPDASWNLLHEYLPILQDVVWRGGSNIWCIHDLIPLLYPGLFGSALHKCFLDWFEMILPHCSAVVTVSKTVAEDFINYLLAKELPKKPSLRIGWFRLGADFQVDAERSASQQVQDICLRVPFFLSVGTLEPRKNHAVALAAFDILWRARIDVQYVIVGKYGWLAEALRDRILRHPEFGRRLFWFEHADDTDLRLLYRRATTVIQSSIAEGFGLPIIEAAHLGTPVIASDIRIFREVGGRSISYFDPMDPNALARRIQDALVSPREAPSIAHVSWKEATERLIGLVRDETYPYRLD
jgi:glycosyltransferase involved in cell wall biosynthesis